MNSTLENQQHNRQEFILPPLTPETIERAKQGVASARDRHINETIQEALCRAEAVASGSSEQKISGEFRRTFLRTAIHSLFRVKVEFPERLPTTPALITANHLNHIDPFLLFSELPAHPFCQIMGDARSLYNQWWKRQFLRIGKGVIPLERIWKEEMAVVEGAKAGREDLASLAAAIQEYVPKGNSIEAMRRLDRIVQATFARGEGIMLFPEGRLGNVEGELLPLKRGAAIYALRYGVPIVPIALIGTQDLYFGKELTLRIGEPLVFPQSNRPKPFDVQAVLNELQGALTALLPKDYREPTGLKPLRHFLNNLFL
jgi:1-acyl-sn-glycerol-3-phosphate acyltransferase